MPSPVAATALAALVAVGLTSTSLVSPAAAHWPLMQLKSYAVGASCTGPTTQLNTPFLAVVGACYSYGPYGVSYKVGACSSKTGGNVTFYDNPTACSGTTAVYGFGTCLSAFNPFGSFGAGAPYDDVVIGCVEYTTYVNMTTYSNGTCDAGAQVSNVPLAANSPGATGPCLGGSTLGVDSTSQYVTQTTYENKNCTGDSTTSTYSVNMCNKLSNSSSEYATLDVFVHPATPSPTAPTSGASTWSVAAAAAIASVVVGAAVA